MYGRVHTSLDIIICSHAIDTIKNNYMFVCFDNDDMVCGHVYKIFILQYFLFGLPFILYCWIVVFAVYPSSTDYLFLDVPSVFLGRRRFG